MSAVVPAGGGGFGVMVRRAVYLGVSTQVIPDDLARGINASCIRTGTRVDGRIVAAVVQETVAAVPAVDVSPDDLARRVDAKCLGAVGAQRVIEGRVGASNIANKDVTDVVSVVVIPNDLACIVDARCHRAGRARHGIVEGRNGAA